MLQVGGLSFGLLWVSWGMVGLILSMILGVVMPGRMAAQLGKRLAAGEIDGASALAAQRRIALVGAINPLLPVTIVFLMVMKPI